MKEIYLDNAATTQCCKEAAEAVQAALTAEYGNPSSMHAKGLEAEKILREAAGKLAGILKVKEKEIFYTSGGTESDNWALTGTARANARRGRHIITTAVEHPAVSAPLEELKEFSPQFEQDVYDAISLRTCVNRRLTTGAPGEEAMKEEIAASRAWLQAQEN